ncbi:MAG TPA: hypothetical protein VH370_05110 [Humisphaera sp.]|jgi:hypothetical protein|nr:hypothetical protein [Humisphaera sp.]
MPQNDGQPITIDYAASRTRRGRRTFHASTAVVVALNVSIIHFVAFLLSAFLGYLGGSGSTAYVIGHVLGFPGIYLTSMLNAADSPAAWLIAFANSFLWGMLAGVVLGFVGNRFPGDAA